MDLQLRDRCAIVCAASKGLGRATALALAREGARVAICARTAATLQDAAGEIRGATGATVVPIIADVSRADDVQRLVDESAGALGAIDILVTNTGGPASGPFMGFTDADWHAAIDSVLMSVVRLSRAVVPHMRQRGGGRIINITSISAKQPVEGLVLSNALRAAITGLSRTIANELAGDNILVNCVAPGYTKTDRVVELAAAAAAREGVTAGEVQQRTENAIPLRRLASPEEFANVVAFLASGRASYVTGTTLQIDGGYVRGLL
jgi:3-oxoacyl-[acyl-carrier protein] reductase